MDDDADPLIGLAAMAELAGIKPTTIYTYRADGRLPPPDDTTVPGRPRWRLSTYRRWMDSRPGRGARTDLTPHARDTGQDCRGA